ncbi:TPA: alpha/beta hydrolase [Escherichia coli]
MEHGARLSTSRVMAIAFIFMSVLIVLSLSVNVIQGVNTRVLSDNESKVFFEKVKGQYPEMDIKIPFLTVMETLQYKPAESAAKVQCPVLVVIAGQDSVNPPEQGRALYDAVASGTKELYEEADACHYDIYEGAFFERVAAVQTQWFKKHL